MQTIKRVVEKKQYVLAKTYGYKPLPPMYSGEVRQFFADNLPKKYVGAAQEVAKHSDVHSLSGVKIATGFNRIVIGDYGAFLEIPDDAMVKENVRIKPGTERRTTFEYAKYLWYEPRDGSQCKLYFQQRTVEYADYRVGMWYVSPHERELLGHK